MAQSTCLIADGRKMVNIKKNYVKPVINVWMYCVIMYWICNVSMTVTVQTIRKGSTFAAYGANGIIDSRTPTPRVESEQWTRRTSNNNRSSLNNLASKFNNNSNIWRRVRLVTSGTLERSAYQILKTNGNNSATKSTNASEFSRNEKPLLEKENLLVVEEPLLNVSSSNAARLEMSTEFFIVPTLMANITNFNIPLEHTTDLKRMAEKARDVQSSTYNSVPNNSFFAPPTTNSTIQLHMGLTGLRKEPWVVPVLVLCALTMLMLGAFEIFVLFKAWHTCPSRRHLFLGQMLLLGLFICASLGAIITSHPSMLTCGTIRFGVGVAYALVFAALLVKCVFLISLNGGIYLPAPYQGLLLLFAVLIQVAIGTQWLLTKPPQTYTISVPIMGKDLLSSQTNQKALLYPTSYKTHAVTPRVYIPIPAESAEQILLCKTQFQDLLMSLIYIIFLIVFIAIMAIKFRGIRENYREATYIGLAIGGAIPIWLGWILCGLAVSERHKDACIAFGLAATSATIFLIMFMPKGRQLAAMGKEGLYVEDRDEQFCSVSRTGSRYSPSFFHFKPIKYGVMSVCGLPNSTSTAGNSKICANTNNGGAHWVVNPFPFLLCTTCNIGGGIAFYQPANHAQKGTDSQVISLWKRYISPTRRISLYDSRANVKH